MNKSRYYRAFSQDELCSGLELVLSGEGKTSFQELAKAKREQAFPKFFAEHRIMELTMEVQDDAGNEKSRQRASVWIDRDDELVLKTACTCNAFDKDHYGCAHTAAALTAWYLDSEGADFFRGGELETRLKNRAMVDDPFAPGVMKRTDSRLIPYVASHRAENTLPVWGEGEKKARRDLIHMDFEACIEKNMLMITVRAGVSRLYVIKDLPAFLKCCREGGVYTFGKLSTIPERKNCDAFANSLIGILGEALDREEKMHRKQMYFRSKTPNGERRYFTPSDYYMGQLLELLDGKELCFSDRENLRIDLSRKGLKTTLRKVSHGAVLQINEVKPFVDNGVQLYVLDSKGCFAVSASEFDHTDFMRKILFQKEPMFVREADIPALIANVIPKLERYGTVTLKGIEPEKYEREKPSFELYLDLIGGSEVTCVPYALYREPESRYRVFDNASGNYHRNGGEESAFAASLTKLFQTYDPEDGRLSAVYEDEELYHFLEEAVPGLKDMAEVYISDKLRNLKVRKLPKLQVKIGVKPTGLLMNLGNTDLTQQEMTEILSAYSLKKKFHRLKDGSFFTFENEDGELWAAMAELYRHHGGKDASLLKLPLYRAVYLSEMLRDREDVLVEADKRYLDLVRRMEEEERPSVPETLAETLRPYQVEGFYWIRRLKTIGFGGILADDMGLGKTLQVLAFLLSEKLAGKSGRTLRTMIICPASLVYNWKKEIERFTPELSAVVIAGTQTVRRNLIRENADGGAEVWITSYDLLKRDIALYEDIAFANEIIDEAQFIKNQHTQAAQSVRILSSDFRMALTGTPIENHLGELWSILDYLMPGFLYSYGDFQKAFQTPVADGDEESLNRLRRMVHPFILRRLKKDVLQELPDKIEESVTVKLDEEQKRLYDAHAARIRESLAKKGDAEFRTQKLEILAELTRLRQLCCDPALLVDHYRGGSAKLDVCIELVSQAVDGGHKLLLFSQFTSMLDIICSRLTKEGFAYYRIDGSVSKEKRMEMVDSFAYDDVPVFCISLKAGGTGLNLTAADIVIHYDPWWNQAAQNQATDRTHRIGQTNSVTVYELIAEHTIEERIREIKNSKAQLMEDVLSGESISAAKIDREDLLQLLES